MRPAGAHGNRAGHAVVLGASIAGLLAARVLADHYDQVTLLERDDVGPAPVPGHRGGVPQGRHLHALMERGRQIMDELYPSLTRELADSGVPTTEVLVGSRWYFDGRRVHPGPTGLTSVLASRPTLESALRERTLAAGNVRLVPGARAVGLVATGGDRVSGIRVRSAPADPARADPTPADIETAGIETAGIGTAAPRGSGASVRTIDADLVVDASGRGSRAPDWLAELGLPRPPEETVEVDLGYASRTYRRGPGDLDGDLGIIVSTLPGLRGGGAIAQEGDRWIVTLAGMLGDHPPGDPAGFEDFAASLAAPDIHQLIAKAEPLDAPTHFRFRASRRSRYDLLRHPPAGFIAIGDALCSLNPLYAQGMTVAAQQAWALRSCLASGGLGGLGEFDALAGRYFAAAARPTRRAWEIATDSDLRYPAVAGRRVARTRVVNAYIPRVQAATHRDRAIARSFLRVVNLVEPPTTLMTPGAMLRVARHGRRPGGRRGPA